MNSRFEFEGFGSHPFLNEEEVRRTSGGNFKPPPDRRLRPSMRFPRPRRFPTRVGFRSGSVQEPYGQEPRQNSAPSGGLQQTPDDDQAREGNEHVRWVQLSLNRILSLNLPVDGVMSAETRKAISRFQRREKLPVTGAVGPDTERALTAATRGSGKKGIYRENEPFEFEQDEDWEGEVDRNSADYVRWMQRALNQVMSFGLAVDGIAGPQTRSAVRTYQQRRGLTVDGIVGPQTEQALIADGAPAPTFSYLPPTSYVPSPSYKPSPGSQAPIPPDSGRCGLPPRGAQSPSSREFEFEGPTTQSQRVLPRLSLFQNHKISSDRSHFHCQASRWASRINAISNPAIPNCGWRIGSTSFDTGADIIKAIEAAGACTGQKIEIIHIFGHSGSTGLFGTTVTESLGLYTRDPGAFSRSKGGRSIADIPTGWLSDNVIFVLHGCNMANGTDNFAKALYKRLAASRSNPTVYGHINSGCAGRNDSWLVYTKRAPNGRRTTMPATIYQENGCCPP
jgi:peptidoglycan hydrolase-like protein with peptidoglycan-binding domain